MEEKYNFKTLNFADSLKDFLISLGFTKNQVYSHRKDYEVHEFFNLTARQAMREIGMLMRNSLISWKLSLEYKLLREIKQTDVCIGDVRFEDEAEMIKKYGGILIRLCRHDVKNTTAHISENGNFVVDYTFSYEKYHLLIHDHVRGKIYCMDFNDCNIHKNLGAGIFFVLRGAGKLI